LASTKGRVSLFIQVRCQASGGTIVIDQSRRKTASHSLPKDALKLLDSRFVRVGPNLRDQAGRGCGGARGRLTRRGSRSSQK
jgi:hypothetical protein